MAGQFDNNTARYVSGKGVTGAGLTATVRKDEMTPAVAASLARLSPFDLSEPLETNDGFYVFQLLVMPEDLLR